MRIIIISIFMFFGLLSQAMYSQVNTETLRKNFEQDTLLNNISIGFQLAKGNSEYIGLSASYRIDWFTGRYYTFLSTSLDYKEANQSKLIDKGFAHLRFIYNFNNIFATEIFFQKEFNEFISLKDRNLLGAGLRFNINDLFPENESQYLNFNFGTGLMAENELLDLKANSTTNTIRSTNYISAKWQFSDHTKLSTVFYYQVAVNNFENYRVLNETRIDFSLTKQINFFTTFNYRFNNRPPNLIKKYDLFVSNGLAINF